MILHILVWESRPMPRFSFERSSYDGLSLFKATTLKAPLRPKLDVAGLLAFWGDGRHSLKWIDGTFICFLFCHSLWLGEVSALFGMYN